MQENHPMYLVVPCPLIFAHSTTLYHPSALLHTQPCNAVFSNKKGIEWAEKRRSNKWGKMDSTKVEDVRWEKKRWNGGFLRLKFFHIGMSSLLLLFHIPVKHTVNNNLQFDTEVDKIHLHKGSIIFPGQKTLSKPTLCSNFSLTFAIFSSPFVALTILPQSR